MKHSYSAFTDWQTCPSKYFHKQVARDVPYEKTEALEYGDRVHKAFEKRLTTGMQLPEDLKQFEAWARGLDGRKRYVEQRLGIRADGTTCGFYDDDCFWCGKVDVAVVEEPSGLILDWKTGKEREDPTELRMQAVLLKARFPDLMNIQGRYVWLKQNKLGAPHDLSDVARTWAEMRSIDSTISSHAKLNHFPEREGPLCKWCNVLQCRFNRNDALAAAS